MYNNCDYKKGVQSPNLFRIQTGFTMCWDNIGKKVSLGHPCVDSTSKNIHMTLRYMAINRIPSTQLDWQFDEALTKV